MPRIPEELKAETPTVHGPGVGDVLGEQFRLDDFLGRGGMGEVYRGRDLHLERAVAVKVLPPTLSSSARATRALRREAARAIELTHRSLARIYHFSFHEERPFLVMELISGEPLTDHLDAVERLEVAEAVAILSPLADGLDYAHGEGVVHRDVKPANIVLRAEGGGPVLIDFGIAAEVRDQTTRSSGTAPSETLGTLSYMSPEQIRGARPRPPMDLYSLAATAYEMLAGEPPFFRGDPMNVQYQILHEPPPPLEDVPEEVAAAVLRGLAKDPEERFADARSFVRALEGGATARASRAGAPAEEPAGGDAEAVSEGPGVPGEVDGATEAEEEQGELASKASEASPPTRVARPRTGVPGLGSALALGIRAGSAATVGVVAVLGGVAVLQDQVGVPEPGKLLEAWVVGLLFGPGIAWILSRAIMEFAATRRWSQSLVPGWCAPLAGAASLGGFLVGGVLAVASGSTIPERRIFLLIVAALVAASEASWTLVAKTSGSSPPKGTLALRTLGWRVLGHILWLPGLLQVPALRDLWTMNAPFETADVGAATFWVLRLSLGLLPVTAVVAFLLSRELPERWHLSARRLVAALLVVELVLGMPSRPLVVIVGAAPGALLHAWLASLWLRRSPPGDEEEDSP